MINKSSFYCLAVKLLNNKRILLAFAGAKFKFNLSIMSKYYHLLSLISHQAPFKLEDAQKAIVDFNRIGRIT